ncbi:MAG: OB-fold nucleic acid binding domain-containing protein [Nanoarchaeota archaeon]
MTEQQFKRNIAYKLRIGDILMGKPIINQEKFQFLELGNKKIVRVNVIGNIVDRYQSEGEKKYLFLTLDDGSGQIHLKVFGDDMEKFKEIRHGETVLVIGIIRNWNNETYISPEIIKEQNPKYLLIRKLELEKQRLESSEGEPLAKEQIKALKDRILDMVKNSEKDGGLETDRIITEIRDVSPEIINQEMQRLLEEGMIFEPRPGKVRYLG